ncbi:MAG: quinolinate synthase NadA [Nitrospirae bacterium]|nr:quinolinate synthase NadA [Nitrospirota bacterium]
MSAFITPTPVHGSGLDLVSRIGELKKRHDAIILAHNYQIGEVQDVADFVGDSLELSRHAAATDHPVIVFCGVHFMAETAKVLSPGKTVLVPDLHAGCPMSDMISPEEVRRLRSLHPGAVVVTYVNSSAAVKAESDICCTSANAVRIVESIPAHQKIIFLPDQYLGDFVQRKTGRSLILYSGFCPTHVRIMASDIFRERKAHPDALVIAHPECPAPVAECADVVASTSRMAREVLASDKTEVIVGTELGMIHRLSRENPGKTFIPACQSCDCANMKVNSLEKILWALEDMAPEITLSPDVIAGARKALDRMLEIS